MKEKKFKKLVEKTLHVLEGCEVDKNGNKKMHIVGVEKLYKKLNLHDDVSSFNLEIKDRDIATIEALHDTLLDEKVLGLNARSMKESRALTQRMYKSLIKD